MTDQARDITSLNRLGRTLMLVASAGWKPGERNVNAEQRIFDMSDAIERFVRAGVAANDEATKQWYFEQIADVLGMDLPEHVAGRPVV